MHSFIKIKSNAKMEQVYAGLCRNLLLKDPVNRGGAHAQPGDLSSSLALEMLHVVLEFEVDSEYTAWQETVQPNLPWAEDHFLERISGQPLNPPPSEAYWPFAQAGNSAHKKDQVFSHTYPERFWPRFANEGGKMMDSERAVATPIVGIRFEYGDLDDLVFMLRENPMSRQAYLPVWFPEDGHASLVGQRVPCTLGYHFINRGSGILDCTYFLRSCDLVRFLRDDVYMAGRLCHFVAHHTGMIPGDLVVHIANLHAFEGDRHFLGRWGNPRTTQAITDKRAGYDLDALS